MKERSAVDWAITPFRKYAVFSGRAPRAEYWWFYLATTVISFVLGRVDALISEVGFISILFSLATIVPWLAVSVRRLHDIDRTGWWIAAVFGPLILFGALVGAGVIDDNGIESLAIPLVIAVLLFIAAGITLLIFCVTPGTEGDNRYGPNPYGPDNLEEVFA